MSGFEKCYMGRVTDVVFRSEEDQFTIAWFLDASKRRIRVRGTLSSEDIQAKQLHIIGSEGRDKRGDIFFINDRWRGAVAPWTNDPPPDGVAAFLASDAIKGQGIGPTLATILGGVLGDRLWAALTREPDTLAEGLVWMREVQKLRNRERRAAREEDGEDGEAEETLRFWDQVREARAIRSRASLPEDELTERKEAEYAKALEIQEAVLQFGHDRANAMSRLMDLGLSLAYSQRTLDRFGILAVQKIHEDPYILMDVDGISFTKADVIARTKLDPEVEPTDPRRFRALARHVMLHAAREGHTSLPRLRVLEEIRTVGKSEQFGLDPEAILSAAIEGGSVMEHDGDVYLPNLLRNERISAKGIAMLCSSGDRDIPEDAWDPEEVAALSDEQLAAVRMALTKPFSGFFGLPGSGKTRCTAVIKNMGQRMGVPVTFCATTGKAATMMDRASGDENAAEASTLHSLLGVNPRPKPLPEGIVAIDECSMMDSSLLARSIESAVLSKGRTSLVLIGDPNQLPSVGPGAVARDIRDSSIVPVTELTKVFRQDKNTLVAINAMRILHGKFPVFSTTLLTAERMAEINGYFQGAPMVREDIVGNARYRYAQTPEDGAERVRQEVAKLMRKGVDCFEEVQVYTPQHDGKLGTKNLNRILQDLLNPHGQPIYLPLKKAKSGADVEREPRKDKYGIPMRVGDRVMQTKNDKSGRKIVNGMLGRIKRASEDGTVVVRFGSRDVEFEANQVRELALAYATTVNKGQGDQQPYTILCLHHSEHAFMLDKALAFVGATRPTKELIFVGTMKAMRMAVRRVRGASRHTRLADKIRERYFQVQMAKVIELPSEPDVFAEAAPSEEPC